MNLLISWPSSICSADEQDEPRSEANAIEATRSVTSPRLGSERPANGGKKKMVKFKLSKEDDVGRKNHGDSKSGVVRIRVVVTQRELNQILNNESKYSSVDQLLRAMKSRSTKVSQVRASDGGMNGNWRPALESIPEDL
ncbi:hypothetical protein F0562_011054 [Nyssa sinensis]|uniref:Uncharacterized protein n=1 Tax=Nyssa sinensis TaxID=561372 RepID=A0A5J5A5D4_9ASTE|nr:hypothetical protein F0562_011054 [Nyssa sinensis]